MWNRGYLIQRFGYIAMEELESHPEPGRHPVISHSSRKPPPPPPAPPLTHLRLGGTQRLDDVIGARQPKSPGGTWTLVGLCSRGSGHSDMELLAVLLKAESKRNKERLSLTLLLHSLVEGNGTPLQYSCLENPMDRGAWWAAAHVVSKSRTWLSDFTSTFHFHVLEKEVATHSSVLAWRIPGMGKPGGLLSLGSHRVGHDWSDLAAATLNQLIQLKSPLPRELLLILQNIAQMLPPPRRLPGEASAREITLFLAQMEVPNATPPLTLSWAVSVLSL